MNVQEYIESGSIESCVLHLANEREQRELDRLCMEYREIREARNKFEASLERAAMEGAVPPAPFIRDIVLSVAHDTANPNPQAGYSKIDPEKTTRVSRLNWSKLAIATSLILLAGSIALNVFFYKSYTDTRDLNTNLLNEQQELSNANKAIQIQLSQAEKNMDRMKDPNMVLVKMDAVNNSNSTGTIYWDSRSKEVYVLLNQLPQPQDGHQYQLWAIVDGIPVDAGMIDFDKDKHLHRMKNISKAEAFAITLEKAGGSSTPTMAAMLVMGKV